MEAVNGMPEALAIMGIRVVPFESYAHALQCVRGIVRSQRKSFCVAINPEKICRAMRERGLRDVLHRADIGICDGIGIALAARLLHGRRISRCTGADLFLTLIEAAAREGWRVFLLGASEASNAAASAKLLERYPGLQIVGRQHGYFDDSALVVERVNASGTDLLFVAMGSPRQEFWIASHRDAIDAPFCMGVGGTLDVVSGRLKRAPSFWRKTGTEFLYRLLTDPRRMRRQSVLPLFAFMVLKQALSRSVSTG